MSALDYYKILQVDPEADAEVITAAFRALARRLHPDRDITGVEEFRMSELNRAYAVLRDPEKRRRYDEDRALRMKAMGPGADRDHGHPGGLAARWNAAPSHRPGGEPARPGDTVLAFGRYAGMTLADIAKQDVDYLRWLARHSSGLRYRNEIERLLGEALEAGYSSRTSR